MASTVISSSTDQGVEIHCKRFTDTLKFKCEASALYRALTDQAMVSAFTRDKAEIVADIGANFVLFGGNIHGQFTLLVSKSYYQKLI